MPLDWDDYYAHFPNEITNGETSETMEHRFTRLVLNEAYRLGSIGDYKALNDLVDEWSATIKRMSDFVEGAST